jgi:hypothetical protein
MKKSTYNAFLIVLLVISFSCSTQETPVESIGSEQQIDGLALIANGETATIGDLVWCDTNNDGIYDVGEMGIAGVTVNLQCAGDDGIFDTGDDYYDSEVTDANGNYLFTDVPTGHACRIWVDLSTLPPGKVPGVCRTRHNCSPRPGQVYLNLDFCFIETSEGCTPGYWKNHEESWAGTGYTTDQTVESVFADAAGYPALAAASLLDALDFGGGPDAEGAAQILLRAAVAALLNASHPDVNYPTSAADVITMVNAALASGDRDTMLALATSLDNDNNLGCPLN